MINLREMLDFKQQRHHILDYLYDEFYMSKKEVQVNILLMNLVTRNVIPTGNNDIIYCHLDYLIQKDFVDVVAYTKARPSIITITAKGMDLVESNN